MSYPETDGPVEASGDVPVIGLMAALQDSIEAARLCRLGHHAWVPWLSIPNGSYVTWCAREGCKASQQYDL